jgi:hypothetical protein
MRNNAASNMLIAILCISTSSAMSFALFAMSRNSVNMQLLALGCVISQVSALMATASTILVGKSFEPSKVNPADLPAGSVTSSTDTVQLPPIAQTPTQEIPPHA